MSIPEVLEFLMILSFGISWPLKCYRSFKSRTAKGSSVTFTICIALGWPNIIFVTVDIILYFRNKRLDAIADRKN